MNIKVYYTHAEAYDEIDSPLFKVECLDSDIFTVEITTVLDAHNVTEVLDAVKATILDMGNAR